MDEAPNVNNLNGVPNFGHGLPENVPVDIAEEAVVASEPEAALEVEPEVELSETNPE